MRSNAKLSHGATKVGSPMVADAIGTVMDSTKHEVLVAWQGSKLPPRWHSKSSLEIRS